MRGARGWAAVVTQDPSPMYDDGVNTGIEAVEWVSAISAGTIEPVFCAIACY